VISSLHHSCEIDSCVSITIQLRLVTIVSIVLGRYLCAKRGELVVYLLQILFQNTLPHRLFKFFWSNPIIFIKLVEFLNPSISLIQHIISSLNVLIKEIAPNNRDSEVYSAEFNDIVYFQVMKSLICLKSIEYLIDRWL
jgi:hypothetical protein